LLHAEEISTKNNRQAASFLSALENGSGYRFVVSFRNFGKPALHVDRRSVGIQKRSGDITRYNEHMPSFRRSIAACFILVRKPDLFCFLEIYCWKNTGLHLNPGINPN
jgi:hypothetical protein